MDKEQYEAWKGLIEKSVRFMEAVDKALEDGGGKCGVTYWFTCPVCGGKAHVGASPGNGHKHARCDKCGVGFMEQE